MYLNKENLSNDQFWASKNIEIPRYDIEKIIENTNKEPEWIHFGSGNIFRGFIASLQDRLLDKCLTDKGIVVAETFDFEIIENIYKTHDDLVLSVLMPPSGELIKRIYGSIARSISYADTESFNKLKEIFKKESLYMVSFTITEKGYKTTDINGNLINVVKQDIRNGVESPKHIISLIASLLYHRFNNGKHPIAMVSMDNCSQNGEILRKEVLRICDAWNKSGLIEDEFIQYVKDENKVSFPWTMIDKITPRPSEDIRKNLEKEGIEGMGIIKTDKSTFIAPFVNAEVAQYLVIEDKFPNGRRALEECGVMFTDRDTVKNVERMKVTTCLNPLHTALAIFGCLLGFESISEEMKDTQLKKLVEKIGYDEGMPVVIDPEVISPKEFIDEVIHERLTNSHIPDTPQRIAMDTSQKMSIRFGETIKSYIKSDDKNTSDLLYIPLVIAGWCRYLVGKDDAWNDFELSPDPMIDEIKAILSPIVLGHSENVNECLQRLLQNEEIFGLDLKKAGLSKKITDLFTQMIMEKGGIRKTLIKYI